MTLSLISFSLFINIHSALLTRKQLKYHTISHNDQSYMINPIQLSCKISRILIKKKLTILTSERLLLELVKLKALLSSMSPSSDSIDPPWYSSEGTAGTLS